MTSTLIHVCVISGYVTDVLDDAKLYSSHAGKKALDMEDVKLAVQCKLDHSFTTPPPRDVSGVWAETSHQIKCQPDERGVLSCTICTSIDIFAIVQKRYIGINWV